MRQAIIRTNDGLIFAIQNDYVIKCKLLGVAGPLWGESTDHGWISLANVSDAELWFFLWSAPEQTVGQTIETPVAWDTTVLIMTKWMNPSQ